VASGLSDSLTPAFSPGNSRRGNSCSTLLESSRRKRKVRCILRRAVEPLGVCPYSIQCFDRRWASLGLRLSGVRCSRLAKRPPRQSAGHRWYPRPDRSPLARQSKGGFRRVVHRAPTCLRGRRIWRAVTCLWMRSRLPAVPSSARASDGRAKCMFDYRQFSPEYRPTFAGPAVHHGRTGRGSTMTQKCAAARSWERLDRANDSACFRQSSAVAVSRSARASQSAAVGASRPPRATLCRWYAALLAAASACTRAPSSMAESRWANARNSKRRCLPASRVMMNAARPTSTRIVRRRNRGRNRKPRIALKSTLVVAESSF